MERFDLVHHIQDNDKLFEFCHKVVTLSEILKHDESRYLYLVCLISSDTLVDVESCDRSIIETKFIIDHIDLLNLDDKVKKEVLKYARKGIRIARMERKEFAKIEKNRKC